MDVSKLNDYYPNSPVYSVSWEILFNANLNDDLLKKAIQEFSNSFKSKFPIQKPFKEIILDQKINLKDVELSPPPKSRSIGSGMEIKNDEEVILVGTKKLAIITKAHSNFENLSKLIKEILDMFENWFNLEDIEINRLGLRYINHCQLPQDDPKRFNEYFNIKLNKFDNSEILNINISFQELVLNKFNFRTQYHSILIKNKPAIAIDLDCFEVKSIDSVIEYSELMEKSKLFAKMIKQKFAQSITENFVDNVMEGEIW